MTKEKLINLLKENNLNKSKLERNKKRLQKIDITIENINKDYSTKITSSYSENSNIQTNTTKSKIETLYEKKEEKIAGLEAEKKMIEAENVILQDKISDVEISLKCLNFKEKTIIEEHYINGNSYEDIGNRVYFEIYKQTRCGDRIQKIANESIEKVLKMWNK